MFWVDKFSKEIQELILKKNELLSSQNAIYNSLKAAPDFFKKNKTNSSNLEKGSNRILELIDELTRVNVELKDIDLIILSKIEMYMGNVVAKLEFPENTNDVGDYSKKKTVYAVPYISDEDKIQVTPEDLFFLKMLKEALKPSNIIFEEK